jgi:thioesterase domain-containing protein
MPLPSPTAAPGESCKIFGYSVGGLIALETARQLAATGHEAVLVGTLDTGLPSVAVAPENFVETLSMACRVISLDPPPGLAAIDSVGGQILGVSRRAVAARLLPAGFATAYVRAMADTYVFNGEAADAYLPIAHLGPVATLFTSSVKPYGIGTFGERSRRTSSRKKSSKSITWRS